MVVATHGSTYHVRNLEEAKKFVFPSENYLILTKESMDKVHIHYVVSLLDISYNTARRRYGRFFDNKGFINRMYLNKCNL